MRNGGWLDEVRFVRNTANSTDLEYLDHLLQSHEDYHIMDLGEDGPGEDFRTAWDHVERDKIYVKMDDDVVSDTLARRLDAISDLATICLISTADLTLPGRSGSQMTPFHVL